VLETVAVSTLYFHRWAPPSEGSAPSLMLTAKAVSRELKRRGIARSPEELLRFREDHVDHVSHGVAVRDSRKTDPDKQAAAVRLQGWSYRLPEVEPGRRKPDAAVQRLYEQMWHAVEADVECFRGDGHSEQDAAWLAAEVVLDRIAPAPQGKESNRAENIWARRSGRSA